MTWFDFFWTPGAINKIEERGLTQDDVEFVITYPDERDISRSSGREIAKGYTPDGTYLVAVFEMLDDLTVFPITAYRPEKE